MRATPHITIIKEHMMKLDFGRPLPHELPPPPTYTVGDLRATLIYCRSRLRIEDITIHGARLTELGRRLNALELREEIDFSVGELARECYLAGLAAATGIEHEPKNPAIARIIAGVRGAASPAAATAGG